MDDNLSDEGSVISSKSSVIIDPDHIILALKDAARRDSVVMGQSGRGAMISSSLPRTGFMHMPKWEVERIVDEERQLLEDNRLIRPDPIMSYGALQSTVQEHVEHDDRILTSTKVDPQLRWEEAVAMGQIKTTWQRELRHLVQHTLPLILTFLLQSSLTVASVFSVGHLGKQELAAVSLAAMTANITGYSIYQGATTALDTLCPQAYGSGKKKMVGLYLQRAVCILLILSIPIGLVWFFAEDILLLIIPEKELAYLAGKYLRVLAIGAPGYAIFEAAKRFTQAQGLFGASTYVLLIASPFNALLNYLLVWNKTIGMGFVGAPTAVAITDWLMPLLLFCYVYFIDGKSCWGGFSSDAFKGWWTITKLAIPGIIMITAEFLAFEIMTFAASYISVEALAAQSVLATAGSITYQIPFALSVVCANRVGNFVGAGLADGARMTMQVSLFVATLYGVVNTLFLYLGRDVIGYAFSGDEGVVSLAADTFGVVAFVQVFDGLCCVGGGALRGQGRQHIGGFSNLIAYYVVAIPLSFTCAFAVGWALRGLWFGVCAGLILNTFVYVYYLLRSNWPKIVQDSALRSILEA